jgi:transposase InsO family protein
MLGVIKALKEWRCYLEGCMEFTVVTDHNPNVYFPKQTTLSRRQARWMEFMSRFKFAWKHTPGTKNPADGLSRLFACVRSSCAMLCVMELKHDFVSRIPNQYCYDERFNNREFVSKFEYRQGMWFDHRQRIAIPITLVHEVMSAHHDNQQYGHFGSERTLHAISRNFFWPQMRRDVVEYCRTCPECQKNKSETQNPAGLLQPLAISDSRWHTITMDFITGLPTTAKGRDSILVVVDKLSKMVIMIPCKKTCTASHVANLFIAHVESKQGTPKVIISDRDPKFLSEYWRKFCQRLNMKLKFSTAYHPQTDGQTERTNRVVGEVLRNYLSGSMKSWEEVLPYVEFAFNNAKSSSTGETPFFLNYGAHPCTVVTNQLPEMTNLPVLEQVFQSRDEVLSRVQVLLRTAQKNQKRYADTKRRPHSISDNIQVLLSSKNLRFQGKGKRKLYPKILGPFTVTRMIGKNVAELALPSTWNIHNVFHVSLLRPFHDGGRSDQQHLPPVEGKLPNYQVDQIISHRDRHIGRRKIREYLVKWQELSDENNSWETASAIPFEQISQYSAWALSKRGGM